MSTKPELCSHCGLGRGQHSDTGYSPKGVYHRFKTKSDVTPKPELAHKCDGVPRAIWSNGKLPPYGDSILIGNIYVCRDCGKYMSMKIDTTRDIAAHIAKSNAAPKPEYAPAAHCGVWMSPALVCTECDIVDYTCGIKSDLAQARTAEEVVAEFRTDPENERRYQESMQRLGIAERESILDDHGGLHCGPIVEIEHAAPPDAQSSFPLVQELRSRAGVHPGGIYNEAADKIERLLSSNDALKRLAEAHKDERVAAGNAIDRLREEVAALRYSMRNIPNARR